MTKTKIKPKKKTVFVALSGGVDSAVAAALLKERGFEVVGVHIKCWNVDGCGERDAEDARRVAQHLKIPFYVFDFEEEYKKGVVNYMIDGYRQGLTPNPDVMCNKEIKFGLFLKRALALGADYIATGHYVRLEKRAGRYFSGPQNNFFPDSGQPVLRSYYLFVAKDQNKDQSYFLWTLTQEQLKHCLFPIGEYTKPQVRVMAKKFGLPTADKKDSQGICFLGKVTLADFLKDYLPEKRGLVLLAPSRVKGAARPIGEHRGAWFYTIGQRHGFSYRIKNHESRIMAHYVAQKNTENNTLVVTEEDNPALYKKEIFLNNVNFINPIINDSKFMTPVWARVRYRQPLVPATIQQLMTSDVIRLTFNEAQKFIASGQSAVFYNKAGKLLGGGIIV